MAQKGLLRVVITDSTTGLPISGATVEVRSQGATVNGTTGPTTIDIHAQGAIDVGDTLNTDNDSQTGRAVLTQPSAIQLTVAAPGLTSLVNDVTRLTIALPLPSIFNDPAGSETKANPLTTDALGVAFCYVDNAMYDCLVTQSGTKTLLVNQTAEGGDEYISNAFSATEKGWIWDTKRTPGGNSYEWKVGGVTQLSLNAAGTSLTGKSLLLSAALVVVGDTTLSADVIFSQAISIIKPGATSFAIRNNADARDNLLVVDAGDVTVFRDIDARRLVAQQGTQHVAGDYDVTHANWGSPAAVLTFGSYESRDSRGFFQVAVDGAATPGANPDVTLTFKDGTFTTKPFVVATRGDANAPNTATWTVTTSVTQATFTFIGTPVAGTTYGCYFTNIK